MWNIVVGPPGTGKTTFLLSQVERYLENGTNPSKIGYLAFTKKAATEALNRAISKFELDPEELPYFRTIHSLCYKCLGVKRADVIGSDNFKELGELLGERITGTWNVADGYSKTLTKADKMLFLENISRNKTVPFKQEWSDVSPDYSWMHFDWFCKSYRKYKDTRFLLDYTDMLEQFLECKNIPELEVLFIDEAQDLSSLQWKCIRKLADSSKEVFIAGDDDQAIYKWAGADVQQFIDLKGNEIQLTQSYRVPKKIHLLSNQIIQRTKNRRQKVWNPQKREGTIEFQTSYEHMDLTSGNWLILGRNNYLLNSVEDHLKLIGVLYERSNKISVRNSLLEAIFAWETLRKGGVVTLDKVRCVYSFISSKVGIERGKKNLKEASEEDMFSMDKLRKEHGLLRDGIWHEVFDRVGVEEKEYLISCLRKEEKISSPRIKLSTIHAAKGGEADNVLLMTDIANSTWKELYKNSDNENRTFYVAVTRARENLCIIQPTTNKFYQIIF